MKSREEVYNHVTEEIAKMFELDVNDLNETSRLYEDLDIDSIDAVDLIISLNSYIGRKISPDQFKNVRTIGDIVTVVSEIIADKK